MQMRAIESFLALYEDRSFSKASRRLFITQQGLSRQIQALEKELGKLLFERSHFGAEPTETAHLLYPYYQQIFEIYRASETLLDPTQQHTMLRVGFAFGISSAGDPDFLIDFQKLHPDVLVEIQEWSKAECIRKLLHNQLDAAFLINPFPENLFRTCRITGDHMYAAMHKTHPLAADAAPLDFHALDRQMLITGSPENALRQFFDYCCALLLCPGADPSLHPPGFQPQSGCGQYHAGRYGNCHSQLFHGAARDEPRHSHTPAGTALPGISVRLCAAVLRRRVTAGAGNPLCTGPLCTASGAGVSRQNRIKNSPDAFASGLFLILDRKGTDTGVCRG